MNAQPDISPTDVVAALDALADAIPDNGALRNTLAALHARCTEDAATCPEQAKALRDWRSSATCYLAHRWAKLHTATA